MHICPEELALMAAAVPAYYIAKLWVKTKWQAILIWWSCRK